MLARTVRRVVATVIAVAAAQLVGPATSPVAAASGYCAGSGVNVVVDFHQLGGGVHKACDPNGANRTADRVFPAVGFPLDYTQRQPGFVCRVSGKPADDECVNTPPSNAYWGLWWSDGKSGTWSYASQGVGSLKVANGGFVAFSWQGSQAKSPPGAAPTNSQSQPKPTKKPKPKPDPKPTTAPDDPAGTPRPGPAAGDPADGGPDEDVDGSKSAGEHGRHEQHSKHDKHGKPGQRGKHGKSGRSDPSQSGEPDVVAQDEVSSAPVTSAQDQASAPVQDDRLPLWVPLGVLALVLAGTATAVVVRRRTGGAG